MVTLSKLVIHLFLLSFITCLDSSGHLLIKLKWSIFYHIKLQGYQYVRAHLGDISSGIHHGWIIDWNQLLWESMAYYEVARIEESLQWVICAHYHCRIISHSTGYGSAEDTPMLWHAWVIDGHYAPWKDKYRLWSP